MVKHFTCIARFGVSSHHLEENWSGRWVRTSSRRPSLILSFPKRLGTVVPLDAVVPRRGLVAGDTSMPPKVMAPGALLYSIKTLNGSAQGIQKRSKGLSLLVYRLSIEIDDGHIINMHD